MATHVMTKGSKGGMKAARFGVDIIGGALENKAMREDRWKAEWLAKKKKERADETEDDDSDGERVGEGENDDDDERWQRHDVETDQDGDDEF